MWLVADQLGPQYRAWAFLDEKGYLWTRQLSNRLQAKIHPQKKNLNLNLMEIFPSTFCGIFEESECVHMSYPLLVPQMVSGNDNETLGLCGLVAAGTSSTHTGIAGMTFPPKHQEMFHISI